MNNSPNKTNKINEVQQQKVNQSESINLNDQNGEQLNQEQSMFQKQPLKPNNTDRPNTVQMDNQQKSLEQQHRQSQNQNNLRGSSIQDSRYQNTNQSNSRRQSNRRQSILRASQVGGLAFPSLKYTQMTKQKNKKIINLQLDSPNTRKALQNLGLQKEEMKVKTFEEFRFVEDFRNYTYMLKEKAKKLHKEREKIILEQQNLIMTQQKKKQQEKDTKLITFNSEITEELKKNLKNKIIRDIKQEQKIQKLQVKKSLELELESEIYLNDQKIKQIKIQDFIEQRQKNRALSCRNYNQYVQEKNNYVQQQKTIQLETQRNYYSEQKKLREEKLNEFLTQRETLQSSQFNKNNSTFRNQSVDSVRIRVKQQEQQQDEQRIKNFFDNYSEKTERKTYKKQSLQKITSNKLVKQLRSQSLYDWKKQADQEYQDQQMKHFLKRYNDKIQIQKSFFELNEQTRQQNINQRRRYEQMKIERAKELKEIQEKDQLERIYQKREIKEQNCQNLLNLTFQYETSKFIKQNYKLQSAQLKKRQIEQNYQQYYDSILAKQISEKQKINKKKVQYNRIQQELKELRYRQSEKKQNQLAQINQALGKSVDTKQVLKELQPLGITVDAQLLSNYNTKQKEFEQFLKQRKISEQINQKQKSVSPQN